jgi:heme/copper-type cytochrome/quinol oxidase subunit 2
MLKEHRYGRWLVLLSVALGVTAGLAWLSWGWRPALVTTASASRAPAAAGSDTPQESVRHTIDIVARRYQYSPDHIEVQENDLLKITFSTEDIPHSFTIDEYRIAKRAAPGHPVVFEFRADQVGTFRFSCNLTAEEGCRRMHGELVVKPR